MKIFVEGSKSLCSNAKTKRLASQSHLPFLPKMIGSIVRMLPQQMEALSLLLMLLLITWMATLLMRPGAQVTIKNSRNIRKNRIKRPNTKILSSMSLTRKMRIIDAKHTRLSSLERRTLRKHVKIFSGKKLNKKRGINSNWKESLWSVMKETARIEKMKRRLVKM